MDTVRGRRSSVSIPTTKEKEKEIKEESSFKWMRKMYNTIQRRNKTDGLDQRSLERLQQQFAAADNNNSNNNKEDDLMRGFKRSESTMSLPNFGTVKQTDSTSEDSEDNMGTRRDRRKDDPYAYVYNNNTHNATQRQNGSFSIRGKEKDEDKKREPPKANARYSQAVVTSRLPKTLLPHLSISRKKQQTKGRSSSGSNSVTSNSNSSNSSNSSSKNGTVGGENKFGTVAGSKNGNEKKNGADKIGVSGENKLGTVSSSESKLETISENKWSLGDPTASSYRNSVYGIYTISKARNIFPPPKHSNNTM